MLQTEFEFTLPLGFVDERGTLHRDGVMRLSTARDELEAMRDPRVKTNAAFMSVLLLSRVITRLGELREITPETIEGLFSADFVHLQDLFVRCNDVASTVVETACPACGTHFRLDLLQTASEAT